LKKDGKQGTTKDTDGRERNHGRLATELTEYTEGGREEWIFRAGSKRDRGCEVEKREGWKEIKGR